MGKTCFNAKPGYLSNVVQAHGGKPDIAVRSIRNSGEPIVAGSTCLASNARSFGRRGNLPRPVTELPRRGAQLQRLPFLPVRGAGAVVSVTWRSARLATLALLIAINWKGAFSNAFHDPCFRASGAAGACR